MPGRPPSPAPPARSFRDAAGRWPFHLVPSSPRAPLTPRRHRRRRPGPRPPTRPPLRPRSAINALKGIVFGGAVAVSQAAASTFGEVASAAKAQHRAVDLAEFFSKTQGKLTTFVPAICAHTAFFAAYRGNGGETAGWGGMLAPLAVTSLPTIGYAAYTRAAPPPFLAYSLVS